VGDLTKNLSRHEFKCSCGCGCDTIDIRTVEVIQDVCNEFSCSVHITSGYRCVKYNGAVGGAKNSQHLTGRAADCVFKIAGDIIEPKEIDKYLRETYPAIYGFGLYNTFNHIDTRTNGPARWSN
jgi:uncharacterized protein YcbK (DUF882 family)